MTKLKSVKIVTMTVYDGLKNRWARRKFALLNEDTDKRLMRYRLVQKLETDEETLLIYSFDVAKRRWHLESTGSGSPKALTQLRGLFVSLTWKERKITRMKTKRAEHFEKTVEDAKRGKVVFFG